MLVEKSFTSTSSYNYHSKSPLIPGYKLAGKGSMNKVDHPIGSLINV